jgi:hypothetical protein
MNAMGSERSPPSTTAASDPRTTRVNVLLFKLNSGEMRMPPRPASTMVRTHATADVLDELTPFSPAKPRRSTTARISRPTRMCRRTNQRTMADTRAAPKTTSWSDVKASP